MLTLSDISKAYGPKVLFANVSLNVTREDRIGLVGPNGSGKSTLFEMILGTEEPDSGNIQIERNVKIGYLPQESAPATDQTVLELATAVSPEMQEIARQLRTEDDEASLGYLRSRYRELGGFDYQSKAKRILAGLGFKQTDFDRQTQELSGGWVMRAHLARLLTQEPDLLMLDEPTNHLDLQTVLWLQDYLTRYSGAILMISHDREFLNNLVTSIVEIRLSRLFCYTGNYDSFLVQREANEAILLASYKNQQREIDRLMTFVNRFRAKNTKAAQAQSKLKQIERMDKIEAPTDDSKEISFAFPQPERSGHRVITLENVSHSYGDNLVYTNMNFEAERGQRIVLVGPNGAGKSTLLKLLGGVLPIQSGDRDLGHKVKAGYYSQYRIEMLQENRTVLEEALDTPQRVTEQFVRTCLGCFLFSGDDVFKKVSVLSGGEKSRLALVKLLLDPPNLLLMDEPTTHLDMSSIEALIVALTQFEGTIIFISHDVYFIREIANHVVHVNAGKLTHYPTGWDYYLEKTGRTKAAELVEPVENEPERIKGPSRAELRKIGAAERQARAAVKKKQQERVKKLEAEIVALEKRQAELTAQLESPATYEKKGWVNVINRDLLAVNDQLAELHTSWEQAATELSAQETQTASSEN